MQKVISITLTALCLVACGDDSIAPSKRARDAAVARDASEAHDSAAADSSAPATRDAAVDGGSPGSGDDLPGKTITIRFRARVRGEAFDCSRSYLVPGLGRVEPREFKFYVQDLALIDQSGKEVPVRMLERAPHQTSAVALIDFENATGGCNGTPSTNSEIVGKIAEGEYRGVVFTNGVPEELNHDDPTMFAPPLSDFSMYWNWFQGFKFLVADLGAALPSEADEDAGVAPAQSVLHVGSAACGSNANSEIECAQPHRNRIRLPTFDPDSSVIVADLAAVFAGVDRSQTFCHGGRPACAPVYRNVGLDLNTGKATDTQKVFRLERVDQTR